MVAGAGHRVRVRARSPGRARRALAPRPEGPWGWMLVFCVRIEVVGSLWWQVLDIGIGFGPEGPEGPWGWMLVFCVRIKVMGSLW